MQPTSVEVSSRIWERNEALCLLTTKRPLAFKLMILRLLLLESVAWLLEGKGELENEVSKKLENSRVLKWVRWSLFLCVEVDGRTFTACEYEGPCL